MPISASVRRGVRGDRAADLFGALPQPIGRVWGDFHVHTSVSGDGLSSLEEVVTAALKRNYRIIRDIARKNPRKTDMHDSKRFCIDREVDTRCAAMILALKRIEAHYQLEGFSQ